MSLRLRLLSVTIAVSACVIALLTILQIDDLALAWLDGSLQLAQNAAQQAQVSLLSRTEGKIADTLPETKRLWVKLMEEDATLPEMLENAMARSETIVEISVADAAERIVASSNPLRKQRALNSTPSIESLRHANSFARLAALLTGRSDYEFRLPIGFAQETQSVFIIQVLVSPVLLRDLLYPRIRNIALISGGVLAAAILLSVWLSNLMLRNLTRLGEDIDRIASGDMPPSHAEASAREFAVVESKLNLLGQQFRGFHNVLEKLEDAILIFDASRRLVLCGNPAKRLLGPIETGRELKDTSIGEELSEAFEKRIPIKNMPIKNLLADIEFFPGGTIVRVRDPEGRQQLESQIDLTNRLAAVQRLTSGVAHEIKNPLNSITLLLEVLKLKTPETEAELETISQEVRRLDRVVRTFLEFSRPVELNRQPLDASELLSDIGRFLQPDADRRNIKMTMSGTKALINADGDLLRQALLNILMNALESMPAGGDLLVSANPKGGECVIRIQDSGVGIPEEKLDKIFQLYYTTKDNGSGIGLAQTFRAIQLHGGRIQVDSKNTVGTIFTIYIPLAEIAG